MAQPTSIFALLHREPAAVSIPELWGPAVPRKKRPAPEPGPTGPCPQGSPFSLTHITVPKINKSELTLKLFKIRYKEWCALSGRQPPQAEARALAALFGDWFEMLDLDSSGALDVHEIVSALQQAGLESQALVAKEFIQQLDRDGNGEVDWDEFNTFLHNEVAAGRNVFSSDYVLPSGRSIALGPILSLLRRQRMMTEILQEGPARIEWIFKGPEFLHAVSEERAKHEAERQAQLVQEEARRLEELKRRNMQRAQSTINGMTPRTPGRSSYNGRNSLAGEMLSPGRVTSPGTPTTPRISFGSPRYDATMVPPSPGSVPTLTLPPALVATTTTTTTTTTTATTEAAAIASPMQQQLVTQQVQGLVSAASPGAPRRSHLAQATPPSSARGPRPCTAPHNMQSSACAIFSDSSSTYNASMDAHTTADGRVQGHGTTLHGSQRPVTASRVCAHRRPHSRDPRWCWEPTSHDYVDKCDRSLEPELLIEQMAEVLSRDPHIQRTPRRYNALQHGATARPTTAPARAPATACESGMPTPRQQRAQAAITATAEMSEWHAMGMGSHAATGTQGKASHTTIAVPCSAVVGGRLQTAWLSLDTGLQGYGNDNTEPGTDTTISTNTADTAAAESAAAAGAELDAAAPAAAQPVTVLNTDTTSTGSEDRYSAVGATGNIACDAADTAVARVAAAEPAPTAVAAHSSAAPATTQPPTAEPATARFAPQAAANSTAGTPNANTVCTGATMLQLHEPVLGAAAGEPGEPGKHIMHSIPEEEQFGPCTVSDAEASDARESHDVLQQGGEMANVQVEQAGARVKSSTADTVTVAEVQGGSQRPASVPRLPLHLLAPSSPTQQCVSQPVQGSRPWTPRGAREALLVAGRESAQEALNGTPPASPRPHAARHAALQSPTRLVSTWSLRHHTAQVASSALQQQQQESQRPHTARDADSTVRPHVTGHAGMSARPQTAGDVAVTLRPHVPGRTGMSARPQTAGELTVTHRPHTASGMPGPARPCITPLTPVNAATAAIAAASSTAAHTTAPTLSSPHGARPAACASTRRASSEAAAFLAACGPRGPTDAVLRTCESPWQSSDIGPHAATALLSEQGAHGADASWQSGDIGPHAATALLPEQDGDCDKPEPACAGTPTAKGADKRQDVPRLALSDAVPAAATPRSPAKSPAHSPRRPRRPDLSGCGADAAARFLWSADGLGELTIPTVSEPFQRETDKETEKEPEVVWSPRVVSALLSSQAVDAPKTACKDPTHGNRKQHAAAEMEGLVMRGGFAALAAYLAAPSPRARPNTAPYVPTTMLSCQVSPRPSNHPTTTNSIPPHTTSTINAALTQKDPQSARAIASRSCHPTATPPPTTRTEKDPQSARATASGALVHASDKASVHGHGGGKDKATKIPAFLRPAQHNIGPVWDVKQSTERFERLRKLVSREAEGLRRAEGSPPRLRIATPRAVQSARQEWR